MMSVLKAQSLLRVNAHFRYFPSSQGPRVWLHDDDGDDGDIAMAYNDDDGAR